MQDDCMGVMILGLRNSHWNGMWYRHSVYNERMVFRHLSYEYYLYWSIREQMWIFGEKLDTDGVSLAQIKNGKCVKQPGWTTDERLSVEKIECPGSPVIRVRITDNMDHGLRNVCGAYLLLDNTLNDDGNVYYRRQWVSDGKLLEMYVCFDRQTESWKICGKPSSNCKVYATSRTLSLDGEWGTICGELEEDRAVFKFYFSDLNTQDEQYKFAYSPLYYNGVGDPEIHHKGLETFDPIGQFDSIFASKFLGKFPNKSAKSAI